MEKSKSLHELLSDQIYNLEKATSKSHIEMQRHYDSFERRMEMLQLKIEQAKLLREKYVLHLRKKYPEWSIRNLSSALLQNNPDLSQQFYNQDETVRVQNSLLDRLATSQYWGEVTEPVIKSSGYEDEKVKSEVINPSDLANIQHRLDEISNLLMSSQGNSVGAQMQKGVPSNSVYKEIDPTQGNLEPTISLNKALKLHSIDQDQTIMNHGRDVSMQIEVEEEMVPEKDVHIKSIPSMGFEPKQETLSTAITKTDIIMPSQMKMIDVGRSNVITEQRKDQTNVNESMTDGYVDSKKVQPNDKETEAGYASMLQMIGVNKSEQVKIMENDTDISSSSDSIERKLRVSNSNRQLVSKTNVIAKNNTVKEHVPNTQTKSVGSAVTKSLNDKSKQKTKMFDYESSSESMSQIDNASDVKDENGADDFWD